MYVEQSKDDDLTTLRSKIKVVNSKRENQKHYLIVDNLLYYIANTEGDPCLRLHVPKHLRSLVKQYHDSNGHLGVQKLLIRSEENAIAKIV